MSGCVIRCERRKKKCGAEKKNLGAESFLGGVEKVIWPPNTTKRRRRKKKKKKKKPRFFRLGAEKYDFRAPKEQRPIIGALLTRYIFPRNLSDFSKIS